MIDPARAPCGDAPRKGNVKETTLVWLRIGIVAAACAGAVAACSEATEGQAAIPTEAGPSGGAANGSGGARNMPGPAGSGGAQHVSGPDSQAPDVAATGGAPHDGATNVGGTPGDGAATTDPVGEPCEKDSDCKSGLTCLKSSDTVPIIGGGPAAGYCTKECTPEGTDAGALQSAQALCSAVSPLASCIRLSSSTLKAYCFSSCFPGQVPASFKCGARTDLACAPLASGVGFCSPLCSSDAECGSRICDLRSGYCQDAPSGSAPMGTPCGPGSALDKAGGQCAGTCVSVPKPGSSTPLSYCSGLCTLGGVGCGSRLTSSNTIIPGAGVCALSPSSFSGAGDVGFCAQACDCDGDCLHPETVCAKFPGTALPGQRYGACLPIFFGTPLQGRPCGDSGPGPGPTDAGSPGDASGETG